MAKQTELRELIDVLTSAARSGNEYAARTAAQSIFSLFANWESGEFVGITSTGKVVVELAPLNVNIHPIEKLRMKASEPEQVTAYVNAYRMANGNMFFGVGVSEDAAKELAARAAGRNTVIVVAVPVKITVNK